MLIFLKEAHKHADYGLSANADVQVKPANGNAAVSCMQHNSINEMLYEKIQEGSCDLDFNMRLSA